jgi:hypothetical protein
MSEGFLRELLNLKVAGGLVEAPDQNALPECAQHYSDGNPGT